MAKVTAIVPAAGQGKRMGHSVLKQFIEIHGKPILILTLERLAQCSLIDEIVVVSPPDSISRLSSLLKIYGVRKIADVIPGGAERRDSVYNALERTKPEVEIVVIHDGVRPFVSIKKIEEVIRRAEQTGGAVLGIPVRDTLKDVENGIIRQTVDRSTLWHAQTPQVFRRDWICEGYRKAMEQGMVLTDDAQAVEVTGHSVAMVEGDPVNIKITTPEDLKLAERIVSREEK